MPDTPAQAHMHEPLATHTDPSLRRDRSLRRPRARARRATAAGIEWVVPGEAALRLTGAGIGLGVRTNQVLVAGARRRAAAAARSTAHRARRLAPVSAFGAGRRSSSRRGVGL